MKSLGLKTLKTFWRGCLHYNPVRRRFHRRRHSKIDFIYHNEDNKMLKTQLYERANAGRTCQDRATAMESPPNILGAIFGERSSISRNLLILFLILLSFGCYAQTDEVNDSKWRLNISGGFGHMNRSTSAAENTFIYRGWDQSKVEKMTRNLRNGTQTNAEAHYLFNKNIGLGLNYAFFRSWGSINQIYYIPTINGFTEETIGIKEVDYIHFVGPSFHAQSSINHSPWAFSFSLSGGYAHLYGKISTFIPPPRTSGYQNYLPQYSKLSAKGGAFGAYGGAGLEYMLNKRIALGFDVGYFYFSFKKNKIKNIDGSSYRDYGHIDDNFSRLDFSLGIKIYF